MNMTSAIPDQNGTCSHCGMLHVGPCLRIKAIEYYPNGTVKRVEYHAPQPVITATPSREPLGPYTIQGTQGAGQCSEWANACEQDEGA